MFYTLSKALLFLIQPTVWISVLIITALLTRSKRAKKRRGYYALILYLIFGNASLFNWTMHQIEYPRSSYETTSYDYGILLGGYAEFNTNSNTLELFSSGDRLTETMALYHQGVIKKVILSSGVHEEGHPEWSESLISKQFLERCGVDPDDIIIENGSWNTYQNAKLTGSILEQLNHKEEVLLITSAFHMKRAIACFEKQGVRVKPYPVDYYSDDDPVSWSYYVLPSLRTAIDWQIPIKEKVGWIVYKLKGYL